MFLLRVIPGIEIGINDRLYYDPLVNDIRIIATLGGYPLERDVRQVKLYYDKETSIAVTVIDTNRKRVYHVYRHGANTTGLIEVPAHPLGKYEGEELIDLFKYLITPNPWIDDKVRREYFKRIFKSVESILKKSNQSVFSILVHNSIFYISLVANQMECVVRNTLGKTAVISIDEGFISSLDNYLGYNRED